MSDNIERISEYLNERRNVSTEAVGEKVLEADPAVLAKVQQKLAEALMREAEADAGVVTMFDEADCEGVDREAYKSLVTWMFNAFSLLPPIFPEDALFDMSDSLKQTAADIIRSEMPEGTKFIVEQQRTGEWKPFFKIYRNANGDVLDIRKPWFVTRFAADRFLCRCKKENRDGDYRILPVV